jgi:hypothetical protein
MGDRKGTLVRSLTALRALAAEIECARMLSLSAAFFLVLGNDIRVESLRGLWEVGTGKDVASQEAEVRIPVRLGAIDVLTNKGLSILYQVSNR